MCCNLPQLSSTPDDALSGSAAGGTSAEDGGEVDVVCGGTDDWAGMDEGENIGCRLAGADDGQDEGD